MQEIANVNVEVLQLFISAGHNYVGHYGKPPGEHPAEAQSTIQCEAGKGIVGDRYFEKEENFKGQITFFDMDVYEHMREQFGVPACPPSAMRRNVLLRGIDLNRLIGKRFALQGIEFEGTEECRPCFWMEKAVAEGAENFLQGKGGLRARIQSSGALQTGLCALTFLQELDPYANR